MKIFITLVVLAALGGGGYFAWQHYRTRQPDAAETSEVATAIVEARDIRFIVSAAGDIGPADLVSVRPEIGGKISKLPVDIGDVVKANDLLCQLDDKELTTERDTRLTEIEGAKLQLEKSERSYNRNKQLFSEKLISSETFEDSRTDYDLARNTLDRLQKGLRTLDEKLSKTRIQAPFDCTVLVRPVSLGQTVSGTSGYNAGTEIMTVANLKDMIVSAHINQADVTRLKVQQEVEIQVESVPGLKMTGIIERIAPQAIIKNGIKGFSMRVQIQSIDSRVRPGMMAILNIPVGAADNVLAVPLSAVFMEKGDRYVYVKKQENTFERRPITVGIADLSYAEVQKGLSEGEIMALELPPESKDGKKAGKEDAGGKAGKTAKKDAASKTNKTSITPDKATAKTVH